LEKAIAARKSQLGNETFPQPRTGGYCAGMGATRAEQMEELRKLQFALEELKAAA